MREQQSRGAAERGEHEALRDELSADPDPARAKRCTQCQLAPAANPAREQQRGEVHARDEEHRGHRAHQEPQHPPTVLDEVVVQAEHRRAELLVYRVLSGELGGDGRQVRSSRLDADPGSEPRIALKRP